VEERDRVAVVIPLPLDKKRSRNMSFFTPFARWFGRRGRRRPLTPTRRVRYRPPTLEALGTRDLLSTLTVTNLRDTGVSGDGSLRGEIAAAANGDQIVFARALVGHTITLNAANGPLLLNKDLAISGPGAARLTISGNNGTEVFSVAAGASDTITGLTIADGNADGLFLGGGGIVNNGTLTLANSTLSGNHADNNGFFGGGGILNFGSLTVNDSALSDNHADGVFGAGGGIFNGGMLTIEQSTLSGNHADVGQGGGIFNQGTVTIEHSTLSGNHADGGQGGGIFNQGTVTIDHSAVLGNHADGGGAGGGIFNDIVFNGSVGTVTLDHSAVLGNHADGGQGGGIVNQGALTLDFSAVAGNSAVIGADLDNHGGTATLNHSLAGVLDNNSSGTVTLNHSFVGVRMDG
jgi:hypothetical protein